MLHLKNGRATTDNEAMEIGQGVLNITELLYQSQIDEGVEKS
jgi:hypothetical protein